MSVDEDQLRLTLNLVVEFLEDTQRVHVLSVHLSRLDWVDYRLQSFFKRDQLVHNSPHNFGQGHVVGVVNHDEGY